MTFDEFLENKGMTPENTPGSEHVLACEAYKAGYEEGRRPYSSCGKEEIREHKQVLPASVDLRE